MPDQPPRRKVSATSELTNASHTIGAEPELSGLKTRVQALENKFWVALVVAGIFGLSGAWRLSAITSAKRTVDDLVTKSDSVKIIRDEALRQINQERDDATKQINDQANRRKAEIPDTVAAAVKTEVPHAVVTYVNPLKKWLYNIYDLIGQYGGNGWFWSDMQKNAERAKGGITIVRNRTVRSADVFPIA